MARIRISELWVAGSYARGALDCGDLDLVINLIVEEGAWPWPRTVARAVLGHAPDVRLYIGTPEKNSSGATFPEARLVWSATVSDWQTAISAIPANPSATRFARPGDELPLRLEQLYIVNDDTVDHLLDLKHRQMIDWTWVSADEINVRHEDWSDDTHEFAARLRRCCGQKTQAVMQLVIEHFTQHDQCAEWDKHFDKRTEFRIGGAQVLVGRPHVPVHLLNQLFCAHVVLAPHLSRRGPNGLWLFSRGVGHPLEQAFRAVTAYYLRNDRCPDSALESEDWRSIHSLELFPSRRQARDRAKEVKAEWGINLKVAACRGSELLRLIAAVDVIEIDEWRLPISVEGKYFDGAEQLATTDELLTLLTSPSGLSE